MFSGKIICGECGDTFKRRINRCTEYKYAVWCCNTHIKNKEKCHILFIREDALKLAFTTMMNKLIFSHRVILKPYVEGLKNSSTNDTLRRIQQIQTLLVQNTEKRETLTKLLTMGIIDSVIYNQEMNELLTQADSFRDEVKVLQNTVSGDVTKVNETISLMNFTEKGGMLVDFDLMIFEKFVNRIVIRSRNEALFELKCGLKLRERI